MTQEEPAFIPPFRGILPFDYASRDYFFGRQADIDELLAKVLVHRLVVLFGDSGAGKSSLLNAGLMPALERYGNMRFERIRVRPHPSEPLLVERIATGRQHPLYRPSIFERQGDETEAVLPCSSGWFIEAVRSQPAASPILVFDQFEELFTLFGQSSRTVAADELSIQEEILGIVLGIACDERLRAKLVFSIREDFLGKLQALAVRLPSVLDYRVRLRMLNRRAAYRAVRGPFILHRFDSQLRPELGRTIVRDLEAGGTPDEISPTQLQIVCQRLWDAYHGKMPLIGIAEYRALGGVRGIVKRFFESEVEAVPEVHRRSAISVLGNLVTGAGTRDVVSREKFFGIGEAAAINEVLELLEQRRIINRTAQRGTFYYEISSEYLIPPVLAALAKQAEDAEREAAERRSAETAQAAAEQANKAAEQRYARRVRLANWGLLMLALLLAAGVVYAIVQRNFAVVQRNQAVQSEREAEKEKVRAAENAKTAAENAKEADRQRSVAEQQTALIGALAQATQALNDLGGSSQSALIKALRAVDMVPAGAAIPDDVNGALQRAVQESRLMWTLAPSPEAIHDAVVSPSGDRVALAALRTTRLIELPSGREVGSFFSGTSDGRPSFSKDGSVIAVPSVSGLDFFSARNADRQFPSLPEFSRVALSPDGRTVAGINQASELIVLSKQERVQLLNEKNIEDAVFSPDGAWLFAAGRLADGSDVFLRKWDTKTWKVAKGSRANLGRADRASIVVSGTGEYLGVGDDKFSTLVRADSLEKLRLNDNDIELGGGPMAFTSDSRHFVTSKDDIVMFWAIDCRCPDFSLRTGGLNLLEISFPSKGRMITIDRTGAIRQWDVATSNDYRQFRLEGQYVSYRALGGSAEQALAIAGYLRWGTRWEVASGRYQGSFTYDEANPLEEVLLDQKRTHAAIVFKPVILVLSLASPSKELFSVPAYIGVDIVAESFAQDGHLLVAFEDRLNHNVEITAFPGRDSVAKVSDQPGRVWLSPNPGSFATMRDQERLLRFRTPNATKYTLRVGQPSVVFDMSGTKAAVWEETSSNIRLVEPRGERVTVLGMEEPDTRVTTVAFSPDGTLLAAGDTGRRVHVWDTGTGKKLHVFTGHLHAISEVSFTSDGRKVVSLGADGTVRVYWLDLNELVKQARRLLERFGSAL